MSEVTVPFGDDAQETAILLLAAAEESKDHEADAVRTGTGVFYVPKEIAKAAGVNYASDDDDEDEEPAPPAKKTAAKKASK